MFKMLRLGFLKKKRKRSKAETRAIFQKFARQYGNTLKRTRVQSSNIQSVGYNAESKILDVKFKGSKQVYRYANVPVKLHEKFMNAPSKGKYFIKHIRGQEEKYPFTKLKPLTKRR